MLIKNNLNRTLELKLKPHMNCIFNPVPGLKILHLHALYSCKVRGASTVIFGHLKMLHVHQNKIK